jgi:hypothetical protein
VLVVALLDHLVHVVLDPAGTTAFEGEDRGREDQDHEDGDDDGDDANGPPVSRWAASYVS